MKNIPHHVYDVPLRDSSRIQIIETLEGLPRARKHQYAAFIRDESSLLVWADSAYRVLDVAKEIEKKIIELIWDDGDSVGRYEKVVEGNNQFQLEKGYTPAKRERVLLQPLIIAGVYHHDQIFLTSGMDRHLRIHWWWSENPPSRGCHHRSLVSFSSSFDKSNLVFLNGTISHPH